LAEIARRFRPKRDFRMIHHIPAATRIPTRITTRSYRGTEISPRVKGAFKDSGRSIDL
jgi:hypothetical protein